MCWFFVFFQVWGWGCCVYLNVFVGCVYVNVFGWEGDESWGCYLFSSGNLNRMWLLLRY